jgi:hypothetical protein
MTPSQLFHRKGARPHSCPSDDGRFSWKARDASIVIERYFGEKDGPKLSTVALYTVFTDLACENNAEEFIVPIRELARRIGVSDRHVRVILPILAELELVGWIESPGRTAFDQGPNRFKLLSLSTRRQDTPP